MSNIFTDFVRVYVQPDYEIGHVEPEWIAWMLIGPRGSYHVPVWIRRAPDGSFVDIQYGSGKSPDIVDFCEHHVGYWRYRTIWGRRFDEGTDQDEIWQNDINGPRRYCRYGFDEIRVMTTEQCVPVAPEAPWQQYPDGSWRLPVAGSYHTDGELWQHRCADDWDNCLDADFLRFTGATDLLASDEVYERAQQDWETRPR